MKLNISGVTYSIMSTLQFCTLKQAFGTPCFGSPDPVLVSPDKKTQDFERLAADKKLSLVPSTAGGAMAMPPPVQMPQRLQGLDDEMKLLIMQLVSGAFLIWVVEAFRRIT